MSSKGPMVRCLMMSGMEPAKKGFRVVCVLHAVNIFVQYNIQQRYPYVLISSHTLSNWWFGTFFIFPYIGNVIIQIDFHIFQMGSHHQPVIYILYIYICIHKFRSDFSRHRLGLRPLQEEEIVHVPKIITQTRQVQQSLGCRRAGAGDRLGWCAMAWNERFLEKLGSLENVKLLNLASLFECFLFLNLF